MGYEWFSFAVIMAIGQFSPGPDMILLTRVALANGRAAGWATAVGIACGLAIHAALAVAGLAVLLEEFTVLEMTLSIVAACYLLWLAWCLWQGTRSGEAVVLEEGQKREISLVQHWRRGFFCNVLNPKVAIFLAGVTLPFAKLDTSTWWQLTLWLTIVFEGVILWCLWVVALQQRVVRKWYAKLAVWIDLAFALLLVILAGVLLFRVL